MTNQVIFKQNKMERRKRPTASIVNAQPANDKIQWKKLGGGFLRLPNRIIKPGDIFWASPNEIPKAFRDQVVPLNPEDLKKGESKPAEEIVPEVKVTYFKKKRPDSEEFDIIDAQGKRVNSRPLSEERADTYLKSLLG